MYKEILDSLVEPIVFCDLEHEIVYMNEAAIKKYDKRRDKNLLGSSIFDCHNDNSNKVIIEIFEKMQRGELDEQIISDNEKNRVFMRAVRDDAGQLIGYYERYEY